VKVEFLGRVYPDYKNLTITDSQKVHWSFDDPKYAAEIEVYISDSEVRAVCEVEPFTPQILRHLRARAQDCTSLAVNLFTFVTGSSFVIVLDRWVNPDGEAGPIHLQADDVGTVVSALSVEENGTLKGFNDAYKVLISEPHAAFAMNDLATCLSHPDMTAVNCGRVLDALMRLVCQGLPEKRAWAHFQQQLRFDESYIKPISAFSKGPRHGIRRDLTELQRGAIQHHTWVAMNRFIEYRKRGNALPAAEFPILSG
jgi:hypothetical protein